MEKYKCIGCLSFDKEMNVLKYKSKLSAKQVCNYSVLFHSVMFKKLEKKTFLPLLFFLLFIFFSLLSHCYVVEYMNESKHVFSQCINK